MANTPPLNSTVDANQNAAPGGGVDIAILTVENASAATTTMASREAEQLLNTTLPTDTSEGRKLEVAALGHFG